MTKRTRGRWILASWLAVLLIGSGLGCHPASSTGTAPHTSRTTTQPDNKGEPIKPPKPSPG
jgi:hypothetical protein